MQVFVTRVNDLSVHLMPVHALGLGVEKLSLVFDRLFVDFVVLFIFEVLGGLVPVNDVLVDGVVFYHVLT
jgi:hypothetical protein